MDGAKVMKIIGDAYSFHSVVSLIRSSSLFSHRACMDIAFLHLSSKGQDLAFGGINMQTYSEKAALI